jgi:radical SAM superfamily enzyme YgiQ (UPF0313 family)
MSPPGRGSRKIVLHHPPRMRGNYLTEQRLTLELLAISALPRREGYEVVIVDEMVEDSPVERVIEECRDALCFGTSCIAGYQVYGSYLMAKAVREAYPDLPLIWGGWFPSVRPDMILESGYGDVVVMRQGEVTFLELVEAIRDGGGFEGIAGIRYRDGGEIRSTPPRPIVDLNSLPPMPYDLIDYERYIATDRYTRVRAFLNAARGTEALTEDVRCLWYFSSYGCPDNCAFCTSPGVTKRKWTALKAERILDEVEYMVRKHHFNVLHFCDANFSVNEKRVFEFAEGLLRKGIKVFWAATAEAKIVNGFDDAVMDTLAESGCYALMVGGESGSTGTLEIIDKNLGPEDVMTCLERSTSRGITNILSYIVGFPGEPRENIDETIAMCCRVKSRFLSAEAEVRYFFPLPGTPMYDRAVKEGHRGPETFEEWGRVKFDAPHYSMNRVSERQRKEIARCRKYYHYWCSERLKEGTALSLAEKVLHRSARYRLKNRILGFPIEFKLYDLYRTRNGSARADLPGSRPSSG